MQKNCLGYPVEFVKDIFGESPVLSDLLVKVGGERPRVFIVADMNVVQRVAGLGAKIGRYVNEHGIRLAGNPVVMSAGEKIKTDNLQSALRVISAILECKLGRNDIVMAIGGGTLLDVAGYAAAQVRGGVKLVRIPTTPAAMIDAAFADYAALDSVNVKDALRVPSTPAGVIVDVMLAKSVMDGVWASGVGEAVRLAVSTDSALLKKLVKLGDAYCNRDLDALQEMAESVHAVRAKKGSSGFGLWAAARLESLSGYKLPHGYSVPIGLRIDLAYSVEKGLLKAKDGDLVIGFLQSVGALDGLSHSQHLLTQTDSLLRGLDAWLLTYPEDGVPVLAGIGKLTTETKPDCEIFGRILKSLISSPREP